MKTHSQFGCPLPFQPSLTSHKTDLRSPSSDTLLNEDNPSCHLRDGQKHASVRRTKKKYSEDNTQDVSDLQ